MRSNRLIFILSFLSFHMFDSTSSPSNENGFAIAVRVDCSRKLGVAAVLYYNASKSFSSIHFPLLNRRRKWFKNGNHQNHPAAEEAMGHRLDREIVFDVIMTTIDMDC